MWSSTYEATFNGVDAARIWAVWTDVERWSAWQGDVESARLEGPFAAGSMIRFKPKGGPRVRIELTEVEAPRRYVDVTHLLLARMEDVHELEVHGDDVIVRNRISITGPLAFVWRKLVAEDVAASLPEQTARLVEQARHGRDTVSA